MLQRSWCIIPGDPPGTYTYNVSIDGEPRGEFVFCAIEVPDQNVNVDPRELHCPNKFNSVERVPCHSSARRRSEFAAASATGDPVHPRRLGPPARSDGQRHPGRATPNYDRLLATCPQGLIDASETFVGLPKGQMGNSEVGHMNLGAGRVVVPDLPRIDDAIEDGSLATRPALVDLIAS